MTQAEQPAQSTLFDAAPSPPGSRRAEELEPGAVVLHGFASEEAPSLLQAIEQVAQVAPWRHMTTARGWTMSVATTNCGDAGWLSDRSGYRYDAIDPLTNRRWPPLPAVFADMASRAASMAGFERFHPDACLINRYQPGAKLSLHQDRDEHSFGEPIVSVSLGVPAIFLWGGDARVQRPRRVLLEHGDVVVWGGPARLNFHGIDTLRENSHALTGHFRFNLTFRRAQ